jgi:hypothetical protein
VEPVAPALTSDALHHRTEPASTPVRTAAASDPAGDAPKTQPAPSADSAKRELGQTLVRAALRWVAAGPPPIAAVAPVDPAPVSAVREGTSRAAMASVPGGDGEVEAQPPTTAATSAVPNSSAPERHVTPPPAVRSARVVSARDLPAARLRRNETVEVSIGAIHVRVDAPPPQTAARPAAPPAAAAQRAAGTAPQRSALARRALRRI